MCGRGSRLTRISSTGSAGKTRCAQFSRPPKAGHVNLFVARCLAPGPPLGVLGRLPRHERPHALLEPETAFGTTQPRVGAGKTRGAAGSRRSLAKFALRCRHSQGLEEYDTYLGISSVVAELKWGKSACGHPGIVHGGALAASFDDAFGALFFSRRMGNGFTARLEIDYKRPVPAGTPLRLVSEVDSIEGRKVWMKATLQNRSAPGEEPVVYARSRCLFIVARVPKPEELHAKPEDSPQR